MYNYQYIFDVKKWNTGAKQYLTDICTKYHLEYFLEKNIVDDKEVTINFRGKKENLNKFEFRFIKGFSNILKIEDFVKTSTSISPKILKDNSDFDINTCNLKLYSKRKKIISIDVKSEIIKLIKSGKIGLIRSVNGYYLVAIATKSKPVKMIRELLKIPTKTIPLLIKNTTQSKFANFSKKEEELLNSKIVPLVRVRKRHIHRLEKVKNAPVGLVTFNNFYEIKLPKNSFEEFLSFNTNQPLVFYKIKNTDELVDKIDFIVNTPKSFIDFPDSFMQKVYGRDMILDIGFGLAPLSINLPNKIEKECYCIIDGNIAIAKEDKILFAHNINKKDFFNINDFKSDCSIEAKEKDYLAILHTFLSEFNDAIVFSFTNKTCKILQYKENNFEILYKFEEDIKTLFDKTLDTDATYQNEAQLHADAKYEICHKNSFKYEINNKIIKIIFDKDTTKTLQSSALINTTTKIVSKIIEEENTNIVLCGEIFENKNLTENIIEYLDDNEKNYYISQNVPLNTSTIPIGVLLDFYLNK